MGGYRDLSAISWATGALDAAVDWGNKARVLAERLDHRAWAIAALVCIGAVNLWRDQPRASDELEETLELTRLEGVRQRRRPRLPPSRRILVARRGGTRSPSLTRGAGIDYCSQHDLDSSRPHLIAILGDARPRTGSLERGRTLHERCARTPRRRPTPPSFALGTLGLLRARRGDPAVVGGARQSSCSWPSRRASSGDLAPCGCESRSSLARRPPRCRGRRDGPSLRTGTSDLQAGVGTRPARALAQAGGASRIRSQAPPSPTRGSSRATGIPPRSVDRARLSVRGGAARWPTRTTTPPSGGPSTSSRRWALLRPRAIVARRLRRSAAFGDSREGRARGRAANPANLTARELEILALVAEGLRNGESRNAVVRLAEDRGPSRLGHPAQARRPHPR